MFTQLRPVSWLALAMAIAIGLVGCSRSSDEAKRDGPNARASQANDAAVDNVRAAARALAEPNASVDYVAAELRGAIKARTSSQALIHYDGYRVTLTTPSDRVTRITFDLVDARPSVKQLTQVFGTPEEVGRGAMYTYYAAATGATIRILAETTTRPATETSLIRRIVIEGASTR